VGRKPVTKIRNRLKFPIFGLNPIAIKGCMIFKVKVFFCVLACAAIVAHADDLDSTDLQIGKRAPADTESWRQDSIVRYDPLMPGVASLIIPGAGQFATGHYVKGCFFAGLEGAMASSVYFWQQSADLRDQEADQFLHRSWADSGIDRVTYLEKSYLSRYSALDARFSSYSFLSWAIGAYIFCELDVLDHSNKWKDTKEKNPTKAGLLSAIPGLGLGQLYNGSYSKAGMIMMGQVSLGMMAYGNHRLMRKAEDNYARVASANDTLTKQIASEYEGYWTSNRNQAFTNRNLFLWYSLFFYVYGIFDAVVDAHLHDYPDKMKIQPDLTVGTRGFKFSLHTTF
jgi:hypothetical protein